MNPTFRHHISGNAVAFGIDNATAGYATPWHSHDEYMVLIPRSLGLSFSTETATRPCRMSPFEYVMVPPGVEHATRSLQLRQRHLALYIDPDYVRHVGQRLPQRSGAEIACGAPVPVTTQITYLVRTREEFARPAAHLDGPSSLQAVDSLLADVCVATAFARRSTRASVQSCHSIFVAEIRQYIETHLAERPNLDQMAERFCVSRRQLTRMFRRETGLSLTEFANRRRVERAHARLQNPDVTVLDAAFDVGIESPSYLARLFRRYRGVPPRRDRS